MGWPTRDFHAPVSLRDRLPDMTRRQTGVLAGGLGILAAALVVWRFVLRGEDV
jgi:hypothetical protein